MPTKQGKYHHLYNTTRWRARRKAQLDAEPLCRICKRQGRATPARVADHIKPHRGDLTLFWCGDLQSLCKPCHDSTKAQEERSGKVRGCDKDGTPLDANHHWHAPTS